MSRIKVYGADWCEDTHRTRHRLDELNIPYDYINVDESQAANEWITQQNNGKRKTPTVDMSGQILIEPTNPELDEVLRSHGLL